MSIYFGKNDDTYNIDDESGKIGIGIFSRAVQVWVGQQKQNQTIEDVAETFNCDVQMVEEAVDWHPWMFNYNGTIEHDGE